MLDALFEATIARATELSVESTRSTQKVTGLAAAANEFKDRLAAAGEEAAEALEELGSRLDAARRRLEDAHGEALAAVDDVQSRCDAAERRVEVLLEEAEAAITTVADERRAALGRQRDEFDSLKSELESLYEALKDLWQEAHRLENATELDAQRFVRALDALWADLKAAAVEWGRTMRDFERALGVGLERLALRSDQALHDQAAALGDLRRGFAETHNLALARLKDLLLAAGPERLEGCLTPVLDEALEAAESLASADASLDASDRELHGFLGRLPDLAHAAEWLDLARWLKRLGS